MKKTYVTSMPNHIGAFLKASEIFAASGINITRVSYNKAVDSHALFIDAEGTEQSLKQVDTELEKIGYLQNDYDKKSVVLIEFRLRDIPGGVTDILRLINEFSFNISYISSQENGTDYQYFKMGLYVDSHGRFAEFLKEAEKLCKVRIIDFNGTEKNYDNSIFYNTYVSGLAALMNLPEENEKDLLINVNLAMQTLDERGLSPYRTFDGISRFTELLAACKGENFSPRITTHKITENTEITLIEPPCGSNTAIINSNGKILFIDSGYACYAAEMTDIFKKLIPGFENMKKTILVTHADVDHCGLLPMFDEIIANERTAYCLKTEYNGKSGFREENPLHKPYISICKILTSYKVPDPDKITVMWDNIPNLSEPLTKIGLFDFEELHFEVYEGKGGHLPGEIVLVDRTHRIAFTGDIYINVHELTPQQAEYNRYAPILMTSVDTDPTLCAVERRALADLTDGDAWQIFGAHGFKKC